MAKSNPSRPHYRLLLSSAAGALGWSAAIYLGATSPWLVAWLCGSTVYLGASWLTLFGHDSVATAEFAQEDDPGAEAITLIVAAGAYMSLVAVFDAIRDARASEEAARLLATLMALIALCTGWLAIQTSMAFHYARVYYSQRDSHPGYQKGLLFPGTESPTHLDFLYYSAVIGMTSQVSDIQVATSRMRLITLLHGLAAFAFNVLVVALAINAIAATLPSLLH